MMIIMENNFLKLASTSKRSLQFTGLLNFPFFLEILSKHFFLRINIFNYKFELEIFGLEHECFYLRK
jgi:hypothetical protein